MYNTTAQQIKSTITSKHFNQSSSQDHADISGLPSTSAIYCDLVSQNVLLHLAINASLLIFLLYIDFFFCKKFRSHDKLVTRQRARSNSTEDTSIDRRYLIVSLLILLSFTMVLFAHLANVGACFYDLTNVSTIIGVCINIFYVLCGVPIMILFDMRLNDISKDTIYEPSMKWKIFLFILALLWALATFLYILTYIMDSIFLRSDTGLILFGTAAIGLYFVVGTVSLVLIVSTLRKV